MTQMVFFFFILSELANVGTGLRIGVPTSCYPDGAFT